MRNLRAGRCSVRLLLVSAVLLAITAGVAMATGAVSSIIGADGTIHGCYKQQNGQLRVVVAGEECGPSELALQWNQLGPQGDIGAQGPQGPQGEPGVDGTDGVDGLPGRDGTDGANGTNGIDGIDGIDGTNGTNGTNGAQGPQGPAGPGGASAWALVASDGTVVNSSGISGVTKIATGAYVINRSPNFVGCAVLATIAGFSGEVTAIPVAEGALVTTYDSQGLAGPGTSNRIFSFAAFC